ncbi:hypothetical protein CDL15_Pgr004749 [Punica granatum]|uniref:Glycoside hydrolase family 19 catalytic domain-containing protein n=2 Tax=Punica granatum TaxID=22663 RepID=A0A218W5X0_PUNGR|nr:hypothetical protein CDL15_Pgr004749 [Punica granatum]
MRSLCALALLVLVSITALEANAQQRGGVGSIISLPLFDQMLKHRNDAACPGKGFYTYDAFIAAANSFRGFGTTGVVETRKREVAAFLGQTSHETRGGGPKSPDGPFSWGYCFVKERDQKVYCDNKPGWPCAPGQKYFGRGPIQLTYNYNYGQAGKALNVDLLKNPDAVATDPVLTFKTALWFWMTPQAAKPSSHQVITGQWKPTGSDSASGRVPGYGLITNIINGKVECGKGRNSFVESRIGFYKRYADMLKVGYGSNLDCYNQRPYA